MLLEAKKHYDLLIDENNDPFRDDDKIKVYMNRWNQYLFDSVEISAKSNVLEVGVGTGRVAIQVLNKQVNNFIGLDISEKTIARAKENLSDFDNVEIYCKSIEDYQKNNYFDICYSVLTFMHIRNKGLALKNIYRSLRSGGKLLLSISKEKSDIYDFGTRKIKLHLISTDEYKKIIKKIGFKINFIKENNVAYFFNASK